MYVPKSIFMSNHLLIVLKQMSPSKGSQHWSVNVFSLFFSFVPKYKMSRI